MKWTRFFIPTAKEVPTDAVVPSHQLMLRAGMIRQVASGSYSYLPLGYRALRKVEAIIREEMTGAGAIELHMPALHPIEWWEQTGRVEAMGDVLLGLRGSQDDWRTRTVLGPTHEEVITEHARAYLNSYKQLPITLYQIQTKFRGEARPKSGVLRTREFDMKDAYSFHSKIEGKDGLNETYDRMYLAYCRIFSRCGLPYVPVQAESGPIGGDASHEFMVPTDAGEDFLVKSEDGSYAANLERAEVAPLPGTGGRGSEELKEIHTPGHATIEEVTTFLGCTPDRMIKTIIYKADEKPLIALVRGDHEVNEAKLARVAGVSGVEAAESDMIQEVTGANVGFAGPVGLENVRIITDQAVTIIKDAVTGANKTDYHLTGVNIGRDYEAKEVADIRNAVEGDLAPNGSPLSFLKCIEVGHVFKLGTKYSEAMEANYIDEDGKGKPLIMGCYGIGVNRIMASVIETCHDDNGIIWPASVAPFTVVICALDTREEEVVKTAEMIHDELEKAGVDVLLDDRDARPGFKFKDADLIGFPIRINVGKRGLADGVVEIKNRKTDQMDKIPPADAPVYVNKLVKALTPKADR